MSYQILNPGIELWFSQRYDAVIGFVRSAGYFVVAGAPICSDNDLAFVTKEFSETARAEHAVVCYFGAQDRLRLSLTHTASAEILLGAQPVWSPQSWLAHVTEKSSLRAQLLRAQNKNIIVEEWNIERASTDARLLRILDEWIESRNLPSMHFLVEPQTLQRLYDRKIFTALRNGIPVGFVIISPIPLRQGWLVEQIIRGHNAVNGTAELLLFHAMNFLQQEQAQIVTLGLSPLSVKSNIAQKKLPWWIHSVLTIVRKHGKRFYNFDGLDSFKAKFFPDTWEPVYAIVEQPKLTPRFFYATAKAFSKTSLSLFLLKGSIKAVDHEIHLGAKKIFKRN